MAHQVNIALDVGHADVTFLNGGGDVAFAVVNFNGAVAGSQVDLALDVVDDDVAVAGLQSEVDGLGQVDFEIDASAAVPGGNGRGNFLATLIGADGNGYLAGAAARFVFVGGADSFCGDDTNLIVFIGENGDVTTRGIDGDGRVGGDLPPRKLVGDGRAAFGPHVTEVNIGEVLVNFVIGGEHAGKDKEENKESDFAAGHKRARSIAGAACGDVFDQFDEAPNDENQRPVATE